jgi:hypothetical protein
MNKIGINESMKGTVKITMYNIRSLHLGSFHAKNGSNTIGKNLRANPRPNNKADEWYLFLNNRNNDINTQNITIGS